MSNQEQANDGFESVRPEYMKVDDLDIGSYVEGKFLGTAPNNFTPEKPHFKLQTDSGKILVVNTCGALAKKMESIKVGDQIRIVYEGKDQLKDGVFKGKDAHKVDVLVKR